MTRKRRRHTPDQIIRKLAEGNKLLAAGTELDEVCRHLEIAESTWHRWLAQYGGMKANDAKRLKELEGENARLKKLLAEAELDKSMLKETRRGKLLTPNRDAQRRRRCCATGSGSPNDERAGWSVSTAPPSASTRPPIDDDEAAAARVAAGVRHGAAPVGVAAGREGCPPGGLARSTTSGSGACGATRACRCPTSGARSASTGVGTARRGDVPDPSRTSCGRWTSSSTSPSMAAP